MSDRLYRSKDDRMLAGVAGGLAEMWDADPSLVRLIWALLVFFTGGLALLVYIVMAIVVPEEDDVWPATAPTMPAPGTPPAAAPSGWAPPAAASAGGTSAAATSAAPGEDTVVSPAPAADPATGQALVTPAPEPGAMWASPPVDARRAARMEARAARRAARAERRGSGGLTGAMIGGLVLVVLGVYFLVREWLPQFDFDWFWPAMLILLGVVLLVVALSRKPSDPGGPPR